MKNGEQFNNVGTGNITGEDPSHVEQRPLEKMEIPKAVEISEVNSKESSIILLFTVISTSLSLLNTLNIGPFETTNQTDNLLILSLGIPLVLIMIFRHLYIRIISIFFLLWSSAFVCSYLLGNHDLEPLLLIGILAFSIYFVVGFVLKYLAKVPKYFRSSRGRKHRKFARILLIISALVGFSYYLTNEPTQAGLKAFIDKKFDEVKYWLILSHNRKNEKGKFQKVTVGNYSLMRKYDVFRENCRYYGDDLSLRHKNSIYIYFTMQKGKPPVCRLVTNYVGTSKHLKSYSIKAGEKVFELFPKKNGIKKVFVWFIKTDEYEISSAELEIINRVVNSRETFIMYNGEDFSYTRPVSLGEKKNLRDVLNAYTCIIYTRFMIKP